MAKYTTEFHNLLVNRPITSLSAAPDYDEKGQADWFQAMFDACEKRDWVGGFGIWEWAAWHGDGRNPVKRGDYEVYGKAAADIIYRKFSQVSE